MSSEQSDRSMNGARVLSHDAAVLLLRVAFGGLMLALHGWPKLQKLLAGDTQFADPLGLGPYLSLVLAILAEAGCALLLTLGIASRAVLISLIFTMAVAAFLHHAADPFADRELALLYLFAYAALFVFGSGRYALSRVYQDKLSPRARYWLS